MFIKDYYIHHILNYLYRLPSLCTFEIPDLAFICTLDRVMQGDYLHTVYEEILFTGAWEQSRQLVSRSTLASSTSLPTMARQLVVNWRCGRRPGPRGKRT